MTKDRTNVRIYGDDEGGVWVAPKGSTPPTEANIEAGTAPASPFVEAGWLSDDGVDLDRDESVNDFFGWQGGGLVRSKKTSVKDSFHFVCLEETATILGLYYAGQTGTDVTSGVDATVTQYTVTNQSASDERAWVVSFVDGGFRKVLVVAAGEVTARATVPHKATDLTMYDFTVTIYGDYDVYTVAPA